MVCQGGGNKELLFNEYEFQFRKIKLWRQCESYAHGQYA